MVNDDGDTAAAVEAAGLKNLGQLGKIDFYKELARSFVLIGVGRPKISPSPWDALCMGVPVSGLWASGGLALADGVIAVHQPDPGVG
jgi:hypothetical protein